MTVSKWWGRQCTRSEELCIAAHAQRLTGHAANNEHDGRKVISYS
ncbi:MAG: hypothetical protein ABIN08_05500 [Caldimonas sp.]